MANRFKRFFGGVAEKVSAPFQSKTGQAVRNRVAQGGVYLPFLGEFIGGPIGDFLGGAAGASLQFIKPGSRDRKVAGLKRVGLATGAGLAVGAGLGVASGAGPGASVLSSLSAIFGAGTPATAAAVNSPKAPDSPFHFTVDDTVASSQGQPLTPSAGQSFLTRALGAFFGTGSGTDGVGKGGKGGGSGSGGILGDIFGSGGSAPGFIPNATPEQQAEQRDRTMKMLLLLGGGAAVVAYMVLRK